MLTSPRSYFAAFLLTVGFLTPGVASAQSPWTVTVTPTMNPLPIGFCAAVQIRVVDANGAVPRNSAQTRVTIADFDMAVTGPSVVGQQIDASHWVVCACQGGTAGTAATVTATYPAQALPTSSRIAGVAHQETATFVLGAPKGTSNPPACAANAGRPVAVALPPTAPPVSLATPPATAPAPPPTNPTPIGPATGGRTQLRVRPIANVRAGTPFSVTIEVVDATGTVVPTFNGQFTLSAAATGGSTFAGVGGKHLMTGGVATVTGLALDNAANNYTVTASQLQGTLTAASNAFSVTASTLVVVPSATFLSNLRANTPFAVTVQAFDANSNVAENFTGNVTLHAAAPAAGDFAAPPTITAAAGVATFSGLVLNTAASGYVLTASSPGLTSLPTQAFTVLPTASSSLSNAGGRMQLRMGPIANVRAGTPFSVTIEAVDPTGAVVPTFNGQFTLSAAATGGSTFAGVGGKHLMTGGVATVTGLVLDNAANNYTITASQLQGSLTTVSNTFSVTASAFVVVPSLTFLANLTAGTPFSVIVQALDNRGTVAENFTGNVTLHAVAPAAGGFAMPPTVTAVAGVATFTGLVLNTAASGYVLTASSPGLTSLPTQAFTVLPTASSSLSNAGGRMQLRMGPIANVRAGTPFSVTIEVVDATGTVVPTFNGQFTLSAAATGGSTFAGVGGKHLMTGGVATVTGLVLDNAANNYTVTASQLQGTLTAASNAFSVTASTLVVVPSATFLSNLTAGTPFSVIVQALDNRGTVAENFTGNVTLHAVAPAAGGFAMPPTVTAVAGVATFTGLVLNTAASGYVLTASSLGLTSLPTQAFTVLP